jgi:hypothetical protein
LKGAIAAEILLGVPSRKTTHILETKLVVRQSSAKGSREQGAGSREQGRKELRKLREQLPITNYQ